MSLSELRSLYMTIMSTLSLGPVSALFDERAQDIERTANNLSEMLKDIRATLAQSEGNMHRKE